MSNNEKNKLSCSNLFRYLTEMGDTMNNLLSQAEQEVRQIKQGRLRTKVAIQHIIQGGKIKSAEF